MWRNAGNKQDNNAEAMEIHLAELETRKHDDRPSFNRFRACSLLGAGAAGGFVAGLSTNNVRKLLRFLTLTGKVAGP